MGTDFGVTGRYSSTGLVASLVPSSGQQPVATTSVSRRRGRSPVGRRHLPIVVGGRRAASSMQRFPAVRSFVDCRGVVLGLPPAASLIGLATLPLAAPAAIGRLPPCRRRGPFEARHGDERGHQPGTPVLVALGLSLHSLREKLGPNRSGPKWSNFAKNWGRSGEPAAAAKTRGLPSSRRSMFVFFQVLRTADNASHRHQARLHATSQINIPARLASTRLPRKPWPRRARTLIEHTYRAAQRAAAALCPVSPATIRTSTKPSACSAAMP